jgi:hypothetical protein
MSTRSRWAGGVLAVALVLPPVAGALESRMSLHMLVQIPLLIVAGALLVGNARATAGVFSHRWTRARRDVDPNGVAGLLLSASIVTTWMIPRALDLATTQRSVDAFKVVSLLLAGALIRHSWRAASAITRAFVLGNMTWMAAVVGLLLRDAPVRLCTSYLVSDQVHAGTGLLLLGTAIGVRWFVSLLGSGGQEDAVSARGQHVAAMRDARTDSAF